MRYIPVYDLKFYYTELHQTDLGNEAVIANTAEFLSNLSHRVLNRASSQAKRLENFESRRYLK